MTDARRFYSAKHVECHINAKPLRAWQLFQQLITVGEEYGFDVSILPATALGARLLVCDMDSTIVDSETLDDMAVKAGLGDSVQQITRRAMRGELDFKQALEARVAMFKGMRASLLEEVAAEVCCNPGAEMMIEQAKENGIRTVLVSGGFEPIVSHVANKLGFDRYVCNAMDTVEEKTLSGLVKTPIVDAETKLKTLLEECRSLAIEPDKACCIGDGANDLPMLQAAGLGISYFGKPLLRSVVPYQINVADLKAVIPLLGIRGAVA